jgi:hypothetical protein
MAVDIRKHLLSFPFESPADFMCIKDEKITYSAGALKRRGSSDVTCFEICGLVTSAEINCGRDAAWFLKRVIPSRAFPHSGHSNGS